MNDLLLTITIFLPLACAVPVFILPRGNEKRIKQIGASGALLTFLVSLFLYIGYDTNVAGFQFQQKISWIGSLNISYVVGIDGLSLLLILLTTILTPIALIGTWNSIEKNLKGYTVMVLFLETGIIGVFASLDLFLFYIFWEAMLIPMYFIIGLWGGPDRVYAAVKFFLYTLFGSVLMLVAILALAFFASTIPNGTFTTDLLEL